MELPEFEELLQRPDDTAALDRLLLSASIEEKRVLVRQLAGLKIMGPLADIVSGRMINKTG